MRPEPIIIERTCIKCKNLKKTKRMFFIGTGEYLCFGCFKKRVGGLS